MKARKTKLTMISVRDTAGKCVTMFVQAAFDRPTEKASISIHAYALLQK